MSHALEDNEPYKVRPTSISFGEGPPQVVVYLEHLSKALAYVRDHKITSIEVDTHGSQAQPLHIDFGFLDELPQLNGLECRMNISKKTDLGPLHKLKQLKQLAWPARTTPEIDFSCFAELEYLSFKHQPSTPGWDRLSKLKVLRLSFAGDTNLGFLKPLKSLVRLEVADSPIESMAGIEHLDHLEKLQIFISPKLVDIASIAHCKNLKHLYVDKTKRLTDFSPLAGSKSIEILELRTPVDCLEFVPQMKALRRFSCNEVNSNDLSPLLQAKSLKHLDIYPDKRSYAPKLAEIKQALGL
jgi:hypothetical protein